MAITHVAPTGLIDGTEWAADHVGSSVPGVFDPAAYGAVGDGTTDDQPAVQAAIDAAGAAGGGVIQFDPAKTYYMGSLEVASAAHLYMPHSYVTLADGYLTADDAYSILWQGNQTTFESRTVYTLSGSYSRHATSLTLATAGDAANFAVGDHIYIRTGQTVDNGLTTQPDAEINKVIAKPGGGVLTLAWPTVKPYAQEYFISGTGGLTSTSVTANLAAYGVANVESIIVKSQHLRRMRFAQPHGDTAYGRIGGGLIDCVADDIQWVGPAGFESIGCHAFMSVHNFRGHHPGAAGTYIYTLTADRGCSYFTWDGVDITGEHVVSVHLQEGCAQGMFTNFRFRFPDSTADVNAISIRSRGYDHVIANGIIDGSTLGSALVVDPTVLGGGTISNVRFLGGTNTHYGVFIAAPNWFVTNTPHPYGNKFWALGATGVDTEVRAMGAWVTKDNQTVPLGPLPGNAWVFQCQIQVTEAFNSSGTDTVSIGSGIDSQAFGTNTDVSSTGIKAVTLGGYAGYSPGAHGTINAYYVNGGTEPTTGKAYVELKYHLMPESP